MADVEFLSREPFVPADLTAAAALQDEASRGEARHGSSASQDRSKFAASPHRLAGWLAGLRPQLAQAEGLCLLNHPRYEHHLHYFRYKRLLARRVKRSAVGSVSLAPPLTLCGSSSARYASLPDLTPNPASPRVLQKSGSGRRQVRLRTGRSWMRSVSENSETSRCACTFASLSESAPTVSRIERGVFRG